MRALIPPFARQVLTKVPWYLVRRGIHHRASGIDFLTCVLNFDLSFSAREYMRPDAAGSRFSSCFRLLPVGFVYFCKHEAVGVVPTLPSMRLDEETWERIACT